MTDAIVQTRGARIAYTDCGAGETAYLFLHYWGGSSRTWDGVIAELETQARCVALDQRGWGRSQALDGRYDLDAMADDVLDVAAALGLERYVLVGHSMGGKVAQIVAARGASALAGLVLVAPAPPEPMQAGAGQRAAMLASYGSREGVDQAIRVLAGRPLSDAERERVMEDTLAGAPDAKQEWTERGMIASVGVGLRDFTGPVRVMVGERDQVERPETLRGIFATALPQAIVETFPGVGHLFPIETPDAIASACRSVASGLGTRPWGDAQSASPRLQVAMVLYPGFTLLDLAGPEAALSPHSQIHLFSNTLDPVFSDSGVSINPSRLFSDPSPDLDVLFVPGGLGTQAAMADGDLIDFIGRAGRSAGFVTSVCTGALLLAKAGLLEGYKATTHWALRDDLEAMGVHVVRQRVVTDRNRVTGGGITAGIDFGLVLLAKLRGETVAKLTQLMIEYDPAPPFHTGTPEAAGPELTAMALNAFGTAVEHFMAPKELA